MMKTDIDLDDEAIDAISTFLGEYWEVFFRYLGVRDAKIYQFKSDHGPSGLREIIYQLLKDWKDSEAEPKLRRVVSALWAEHWDVLYLVKITYWKRKFST